MGRGVILYVHLTRISKCLRGKKYPLHHPLISFNRPYSHGKHKCVKITFKITILTYKCPSRFFIMSLYNTYEMSQGEL